jgi:SAM-dependent methyltransferase
MTKGNLLGKIPMYLIYDWIFKRTLGRLPYLRRHSPDIHIFPNTEHTIQAVLREFLDAWPASANASSFLDVGARRAERAHFAEGFRYVGLDIDPAGPDVVQGDICACLGVPDASYDVVFSLDVFEHLERPWDAATECARIAKPVGLLIHRTLFAFRCHPYPVDYWRFSSQGLESLFLRTNAVETITEGYEIMHRRADRRGNRLRDRPPID